MPRRASPVSTQPGAVRELAFDAADRLHSASIHLLRRLRREDTSSGLAPQRLSALSVIVFRGPITLSELAAAEQVRSPTMTRLVSALESQGLVERTQSPEDGRAILLRATSKGRRIMDEGRRRRVAVLARELEMLPEQELRDVARTLDVIERVAGVRHWPLAPEKK